MDTLLGSSWHEAQVAPGQVLSPLSCPCKNSMYQACFKLEFHVFWVNTEQNRSVSPPTNTAVPIPSMLKLRSCV